MSADGSMPMNDRKPKGRWARSVLVLAAWTQLGVGSVAADSLRVAAEPSGCDTVENGLLVADDELVGSILFCPSSGPSFSTCRIAKLERDERAAPEGEPPSKLLALQDVEGLATEGDVVYLIGSHQGKSGGKRRQDREFLVRAKWKKDKEELEVRDAQYELLGRLVDSLKDHLAQGHPLLGDEPDLGQVNVEGLAVCDDQLLLGLRAPLDRQRHALILAADADEWLTAPAAFEPEVMSVDLQGAGVRGLECGERGLVILSGPASDAPGPVAAIYSYDLETGAIVRAPRQVQSLVQTRSGSAPEGICALGANRWVVVAEAEGGGEAEIMLGTWQRPGTP